MNAKQVRELAWFGFNTDYMDWEKMLLKYDMPKDLIEHLWGKFVHMYDFDIMKLFCSLDIVNSDIFADIFTKASKDHRFMDKPFIPKVKYH